MLISQPLRNVGIGLGLVALTAACASCTSSADTPLPLETELLVLNQTSQWYAVVGLEVPGDAGQLLPLLPPGAALRIPLRDVIGHPCPADLVVRAYLLERGDTSGGDGGPPVRFPALASAETIVHPLAGTGENDTAVYTINFRDTPRGRGTILFAQSTSRFQRFDFAGPNLPDVSNVPPVLKNTPVKGRVLDVSGHGIAGVGVMLLPFWREAGEPCPSGLSGAADGLVFCGTDNPTGAACCNTGSAETQLSPPIDATTTDGEGRFVLNGPPGGYAVQVFADGLLFRPTTVFIEAPLENVVFLAEPDPAFLQQDASSAAKPERLVRTAGVRRNVEGGEP